MLDPKTILIFDEATYAALDLSQAIEESEGCVAGPVATLVDTLTILDTTTLAVQSWIANSRTRPKL
jgi:hypothetical protein